MKYAVAASLLCLVLCAGYALLPVPEPELGAPEPRAEPLETPAEELEVLVAPVIVPEAIAELEILEVPAEPLLSGRVNPASGTQPEVHVLLQPECPDGCDLEPIELDADPSSGDFSCEVAPGTWRIVARADGYMPAHEEGIVIVQGEELGEIEMTLERGERITGTVELDGERMPDVHVIAMGLGYSRVGFTDESGRFEILGLPRGSFTVRAYLSGTGGDEQLVSSGSFVALSLGRREKIRGRVLDARGFPVEGAAIYSDYSPVSDSEADPFPAAHGEIYGLGMHGCGPSPECYRQTETDAAGRFEIFGAPGETLTIIAHKGDLTGMVDEVASGEVEVTLREPVWIRIKGDGEAEWGPKLPQLRTATGSVPLPEWAVKIAFRDYDTPDKFK